MSPRQASASLTKARMACGLTQAELGEILGMTQQQVQRYERDGWQKISFWRLAEAADALGLDLSIHARLPASSTARRQESVSGTVWPWRRIGRMDLIRVKLKSAGLSHAINRATRRKKQRFCSVNIMH